ncbi:MULTISPECIES: lysophospholipid acyltransferase family protein [Eubacteriales]|uniref:1-acyl-sn-glycerol-3-phosphate acyltransferase n=1 Tax=Bittarella massiliensis (ex Durand et al. 2017) TaxID=1720313 RepID=A0AAQ1ME12_9FIRM|nr:MULTISPECIES: lysophospholipid acyltransferase family protein [Eubacteriales]ERI99942.1 Acyltransferase [Clostridium sp. ATCC 29733]MZL68278.1 1-acylglycerol-3-phosphate O-acyltransferase [Bittarella massiliensis (ex Durand et al. 2017)]MZL79667.1 1-acylglycerol-3-phosphate O-acyltransferase [Bittarella massiliensis (ex Durand et al. 2017)]SHG22557.1 1-acyl-sn-glycerol-3-phosphate acyltransferase [Bittarella massiliensis (ex Durand et al. 2017)]
MSFYRFAHGVVNVIFRALYRVHYEGRENLPPQGGYVFCSNHISDLDPIFVALPVRQQICYMAKIELFKGHFTGRLLRALGAFPVDRGKGDTSALDRAKEVVKEGKILGVFPEGTRSKTGKLLKLKSGAIVVSAQTGADILPVAICAPKGMHPFAPVYVRYGALIRNEELGLTDMKAASQLKGAKALLTERMATLLEELSCR